MLALFLSLLPHPSFFFLTPFTQGYATWFEGYCVENWGKNQTRSLTDLVSIVDEFVCQFLGGWLIGMTSGRLVEDTWKGLASNAVKPTMDIWKGLASITVKPTMKIKTRGVCCGAYNKNLMNTKYNYRATIMKRKRINKYKHKFWQNNQILATGDAHEEGATKSLAVRLA